MDEAGDVRYFDLFAPVYDRAMFGADGTALRTGLAAAEREVERVLDVAGGSGRGVRALAVPEPVVLDASDGMLRRARAASLAAVRGDAAELPFADDAADAVLVVDALHHVADVDGVLSEAGRVLRPGGVLVVREFDPSTLPGRAIRVAEHLVGFGSSFLTPEELAARMRAAGLDAAIPDRGWSYTAVGVVGGDTGPPGDRGAAAGDRGPEPDDDGSVGRDA